MSDARIDDQKNPSPPAAESPRKIVLTGGPGAGKTAVLELLRHWLCRHTAILPESAGLLFGGGFPRDGSADVQRAAQRAIFYVQRELEAAVAATEVHAMLCDRGAVDGVAYWPGPEDFWSAVGTTREKVISRYHAVIHLRVPDQNHGYGHQNPLRVETEAEAREIDQRILKAWEGHPRRYIIGARADFLEKAERALAILKQELPNCCRAHAAAAIEEAKLVNGLAAAAKETAAV
jgi:predicted ATPase